nr:hypothetical protein [uncultured Bacteroides sp.]
MSLQNKTKSNNYPGSQRVNVAVTWDEGYASYHGRSHGRVDVFFSETRITIAVRSQPMT